MDATLAANSSQSVEQLKPYQWRKGTSGNPNGRPKVVAEFREECREHTATALQTLLSVMNNPKAMSSSKIQAAKVLLSYGWGAPLGEEANGADNRLIINILQLAQGGQQVPAVNVRRLTGADA